MQIKSLINVWLETEQVSLFPYHQVEGWIFIYVLIDWLGVITE